MMDQLVHRLGPIARELASYWTSLPRGEIVPDRMSFDPMLVARVLPFISMLQRCDGDIWRFRVAGTEVERRWGRSFTGLSYLDDELVSRPAADTMRREFCQIVGWPCGSWSRRRVEFVSGRCSAIETLRLPLRANDGRITLIVSCSEEFGDRTAVPADAPREIVMIIDQQFVDIGSGCPGESAHGELSPAS